MKKFIIIPLLVILACCFSVGAFNLVTNSDNRPMTFYESLVTISEVDFELDSISTLSIDIKKIWCAHDTLSDGICDYCGVDPDSDSFGTPAYKADTGMAWLDSVLDVISGILSTILWVVFIIVNILYSVLKLVVLVVDLLLKFCFGLPQ